LATTFDCRWASVLKGTASGMGDTRMRVSCPMDHDFPPHSLAGRLPCRVFSPRRRTGGGICRRFLDHLALADRLVGLLADDGAFSCKLGFQAGEADDARACARRSGGGAIAEPEQ